MKPLERIAQPKKRGRFIEFARRGIERAKKNKTRVIVAAGATGIAVTAAGGLVAWQNYTRNHPSRVEMAKRGINAEQVIRRAATFGLEGWVDSVGGFNRASDWVNTTTNVLHLNPKIIQARERALLNLAQFKTKEGTNAAIGLHDILGNYRRNAFADGKVPGTMPSGRAFFQVIVPLAARAALTRNSDVFETYCKDAQRAIGRAVRILEKQEKDFINENKPEEASNVKGIIWELENLSALFQSAPDNLRRPIANYLNHLDLDGKRAVMTLFSAHDGKPPWQGFSEIRIPNKIRGELRTAVKDFLQM